MKKKIGERLKALLTKTADDAEKLLVETADEKDDVEKKESKDEGNAKSYDELVSMVKDLGEKIAAMAGSKSEKKDESKDEDKAEKKDESKDEDKADKKDADKKDESKDEELSVEERLKALELAVQKLMEGESEEESEDEESEESEGSEESEDDDMEEETTMTGDTAARAEILAPGIKVTKDVKVQALKKAYATSEGKTIIESLSGGKAPTFDSAEKVDTLFIAASELLKASRTTEFSKSKQTRDFNSFLANGGGAAMTPEKMNEINAARYKTN